MKDSDIYYLALMISLVGGTVAIGPDGRTMKWVFAAMIAGNLIMMLLAEWREWVQRRVEQQEWNDAF